MITISHTHEDGTLVLGTDKGDGTAAILKANRFRWFPSIKLWGVPQSRDHLAKRWQIDATRKALEAAGFDVAVEIDDTPRDVAEVKADRAERLDDRKEALEAKAERNAAEAEQRFTRSHDIAYMRNGQPRLAGHYSCKAWDADQKRIENNDRLGAEAYGKAKHYEQAAKVVGKADTYRERPDVTIRRIAKNEAELRKIGREITGRPDWVKDNAGEYKLALVKPSAERLAQLEAAKTFTGHQLEADRTALAEAEAAGYHCHSKATIHVGDKISTGRGSWGCGEVVRVNAKTVSVTTGYSWTDKVSYEEIREVVCPHEAAEVAS